MTEFSWCMLCQADPAEDDLDVVCFACHRRMRAYLAIQEELTEKLRERGL